jgi:membrane-associated phospholipid phosphatase
MNHSASPHFPPLFAVLSLIFCVTASSVGAQVTSPTAPTSTTTPPAIDRSVSLRELPANILADQKDIWLFPAKLAKGKHWWPTIGVLGVTAGFFASDAYSAPPFRTTNDFSGFNSAFSSSNTAALILAVPAAMYGIGWLRKDSYGQTTALLAAEAFADGFLLDLPFKAITARKQPLQYSGNGPYADSFFEGSHNPFHDGGFYSVHAMGAMAVATVLARRYHNHHWVPLVAYGLAGAISFSRITTSNHFPADVFFGGAVGYFISRYVVLPARF